VAIAMAKNLGRAVDFSSFDESAVKAKLAEKSGRVLEFPALASATMFRIDQLGSSFWAAVNNAGEGALSPMDRQRVRTWLARSFAELEREKEWL
jgi:hypothetical protein